MPEPASRVVYTCNFGAYDRLWPVDSSWNCSFVCFTDDANLSSSGWQVRHVSSERGDSPAQLSRMYKLLPHRFLPGCNESLYIDSNVELLRDPCQLFQQYSQQIVYAPAHLERDCAYAEAEVLLASGRLDSTQRDLLRAQVARYAAAGFPRNAGLSENSVLLRRHSGEMEQLMDAWWQEFEQGCCRDQIGLPCALWALQCELGSIRENPRGPQRFFQIHLHRAHADVNPVLRFIRLARLRRWQRWRYKAVAGLSDRLGAFARILRTR